MNTGIDIQIVKETYEQMTDEELSRIATEDAQGLTPEAMEVVKAEIRKRGLNENIIKGVDAQNKEYTIGELDSYCDIICWLPCPVCGSSLEKLNATITGEVMSFIVFTQYKKTLKVACPGCLDKANNNALTLTAILGWWGIPWGFIRTIQSITLNLKNKKTNHSHEHNKYLRGFVLGRIGELETYKDNKEMLKQIIHKQNNN